MARIRCNNSNLNCDIYSRTLSDTINCPETPHHFFIMCKLYKRLRCDITPEIPLESFNLETIFHGSPRYDSNLNHQVQIADQKDLLGSGRFI